MIRELAGLLHRRLIAAFMYSIEGFGAAWKSEEAIKVEITLLPVLVISAAYFGENGVERALMVASVVAVLIVELLNTAIEKTVDRISTESNPLSKKVKDIGSAAVLGAIINVVIVWTLVLR